MISRRCRMASKMHALPSVRVYLKKHIDIGIGSRRFSRCGLPNRLVSTSPGRDPSEFETHYQALVEQLPVIAFCIDLHRGLGELYVSPKSETNGWRMRPRGTNEFIRMTRTV